MVCFKVARAQTGSSRGNSPASVWPLVAALQGLYAGIWGRTVERELKARGLKTLTETIAAAEDTH